jgi:hypothetical protein
LLAIHGKSPASTRPRDRLHRAYYGYREAYRAIVVADG